MPKSSMSAGGRYIHGKSWEHVQFVQKQLFLKSGHVSSVWFLNISMSKIYLNNLSYLKAQNLNILEMIWFQEPTVQSLRPQPEPQTLQGQWSYSCGCPKPCPQCIGRQQFWPISHQASSCHLTSISLISLISVDCHRLPWDPHRSDCNLPFEAWNFPGIQLGFYISEFRMAEVLDSDSPADGSGLDINSILALHQGLQFSAFPYFLQQDPTS